MIEDRNDGLFRILIGTSTWRSPFRMTGDRNWVTADKDTAQQFWRSPSGVTEDRNQAADFIAEGLADMAVALRGDRGSQPSRLGRGVHG
ncbi:hypothetical protein ACPC39_29050 [Streptomyces cellulosae]